MSEENVQTQPQGAYYALTRTHQCKTCWKLYDPRAAWSYLSHMHQGQGPDGDRRRD